MTTITRQIARLRPVPPPETKPRWHTPEQIDPELAAQAWSLLLTKCTRGGWK